MRKVSLYFLILMSAAVLNLYGASPVTDSSALLNDSLRLVKTGEQVSIRYTLDQHHDLEYIFERSLFNRLYTLRTVSLHAKRSDNPRNEAAPPVHVLHDAYSDNIGPFLIDHGGWTGGNHSFNDSIPTAEHRSVRFWVDGKQIRGDTTLQAAQMTISVEQRLFNPNRPSGSDDSLALHEVFCMETVDYQIQKNTIEVSVGHRYTNPTPVKVVRYYGMQSMFADEKHVYTPNGAYPPWTPIDQVDRFNKADWPTFRRFIEKSATGYQASFLYDTGLGTHRELSGNAPVFIGNSHGKSYHSLLNETWRKAGDEDYWQGSYTWFRRPLVDRSDLWGYLGILAGREVIFIDCFSRGERTFRLPKDWQDTPIELLESSPTVQLQVTSNGRCTIRAKGKGQLIIAKRH